MTERRPTAACLGADEIEARLPDELPHWTSGGATIRREYPTRGWTSTLMIANAIGFLAEAANHHPDLGLSYARVTVELATHDAGGVTDRDFDLARRIEELVLWNPAAEPESALEGNPQPFVVG